MRVSTIFSQGGGGGRGGDCGCDHYGSRREDYYSYGGDYYYNGYNRRGCRDYEYERSGRERGGLLDGLLG
ncbi:MAG: hypothetical protein WCB57_04390 [Pseudonocardiaceae bacterium]